MKIIERYSSDDCCWIWLFGFTIVVIDRKKQPPPFSVRNGYHKETRIGKHAIRFIRRPKSA